MMLRIFYVLLLLLVSRRAFAQDPSLSQFFANRLYLNPAFTGIEDGLQITAGSRNQWYAADKGYTFFATAVEWQEPCWNSGFGLMLNHAREGLAPLITTSGALSYSYMPAIGKGNLHIGLQYAFTQKRIDWSSLTFSDELDPVFGDIYESVVASGNESVSYNDFAVGGIWRWDSKSKSTSKSLMNFRSHIGFAMHHLASFFGEGPDESFLHTGAEVPTRITVHGGTIIPLTFLQGVGNNLVLSPNFRYESQGAHPFNMNKSLTHFSGGLYVVFLNKFTVGALYHSRALFAGAKHTNSFTGAVGFSNQPKQSKKDAFDVGISVDVNATGLGLRSNNVYEFNFRYVFRGLKTFCDRTHAPTKGQRWKPGKPLPCPRFEY